MVEYPEIRERAEQENAEIFWADETGVDNCEIVERGFAPKGHPPVLPVETKRVRVSMASAISQEGSLRYIIYRDSMKRIEVLFLPPYAPECNPDEYLKHGLKLSVHSRELPFTAEDIIHKMRSYLSSLQHDPKRLVRFFLHLDVSYCLVAK